MSHSSVERIEFDIFARDRGASRTFDQVGRSADHAGDHIEGVGKSGKVIDKQIEETRTHLRGLIADFEKTGDVTIFKEIRRDRSSLSMLRSMRKELQDLENDAQDVGQAIGQQTSEGFLDAIGSLPSQIKGGAIVAGVSLAALMAPFIGAAIGGAVLGGIGLGGIVGGIAAASSDSRVKTAGAKLGQDLLSGLKGAGTPFIQPLLHSFSELEETGAGFTATLHRGFTELAPLIGPLTKGVQGFVSALDDGLDKVFAGPAKDAIRLLANELPRLGAAIDEMLTDISSQSDGATEGLAELLYIIEDLIIGTGKFIATMSEWFDWIERNGVAITDFGVKVAKGFEWLRLIPVTGQAFGFLEDSLMDANDQVHNNIDASERAKDATGDWNESLKALRDTTADARNNLIAFAKATQDQADPILNLIHRLDDVKKAQQDYTAAVHDHGRKSDQAKAAELRMAEAILAANGAAAAAAGTFDGHFSDALKNTLRAGGMTEQQIRDIEKAARDARKALNSYADVYTAQVRAEFSQYRAGERNPSGRASGGPVAAGTTYMVGESGPELVTFGANGMVHNAAETRAMLSGASGGAAAPTQIEVVGRFEGTGMERDLGEALMRFMRFQVRTVGGGSVQTTYGG